VSTRSEAEFPEEENRDLRRLVAEMLRSFEGGSSGQWIARVGVRTLGNWRERAGLEG
jgi:hypothetical protein